ncbi:hypothetical protein [Thermodesulfovibrio yellowstonii]|uniref:hypothetical protein n=1 Tax=Thermodesulfovibrio yellowstonii TaxID=28262 RepID=UPI0003FC321A|nr:hypothetical protein [Thermodesulfovibrio islandicus]
MRAFLILTLILSFMLCFSPVGYAEDEEMQELEKGKQFDEAYYKDMLELYNFVHQRGDRIDINLEEFGKLFKSLKEKINQRTVTIKKYKDIKDYVFDLKKLYRDEKAPFKLIAAWFPPLTLAAFKYELGQVDLKDTQNGGFFILKLYSDRLEDLKKEAKKSNNACFVDYDFMSGGIGLKEKFIPFQIKTEKGEIVFDLYFARVKKINDDGSALIELKGTPVKVSCEFAGLEKEFNYSVLIDNFDLSFAKKFEHDFFHLSKEEEFNKKARELYTTRLKQLGITEDVVLYICSKEKESCLPPDMMSNFVHTALIKQISDWLKKEMTPRGLLKQ